MKITLQTPNINDESDPVYQKISGLMLAHAARFKRPETELKFNFSTGMEDLSEIASLGSRHRNDHLILDSMIKAATPDVDGMVSHCYFDSALWPARQILDIPIVGLAESSMKLASSIGRRFAVMPVNPRYEQQMEDTIELYGLRANAISYRPVRAIAADEMAAIGWLLEGKLDRLVDAVVPTARACIADGADVLIFGCGLVSVLLSEGAGVTEIDGVPIITPIVAAVKAIETLVDLQKNGMLIKSKVGFWGER
jgi:allantoin racemase